MKPISILVALIFLVLITPALVAQQGAMPRVANPVVVQFMVDGIDANSVKTAIAAGATTLGSLLKQGVTVDTYYCTSPAPRLALPDGSTPWGGSTSSNVAMHTGTHLYESYNIDDIFLSAKRGGIVSMFAGGSRNYAIFKNTDHLYYGGNELTDEIVVDRGLQHLTKDNARLLRLHLQHIRNAWKGPSDTTNPKSEYIQYFVKTVDPQLARLIAGLKSAGVWDRTYIIFGSDHGMGQTSQSGHPQSVLSSWQTFMAFYGPGVKRGAHIPYAEGPDVAVMTNHFLGPAAASRPPRREGADESRPCDRRAARERTRGRAGRREASPVDRAVSEFEHAARRRVRRLPRRDGEVAERVAYRRKPVRAEGRGMMAESTVCHLPSAICPDGLQRSTHSPHQEDRQMRMATILTVLVLLSGPARAQQPAATAPPTPDTDLTKLGYVSAAEIASGLKKLPQDRADVSMRIFQIPPFNVNAAHRAPVTQIANVHDDQTELFMVIDGSGSIVWGGKVVGPTRNGANVTGKTLEGGTTQRLGKGDFFVVPPGLPHMFANIAPGGLQVMQVYLPKTR